ncbi:LytR/AlgR family response regulator transcription factor [Companilactobacillus sp. HBUAS56257]|uniref:LytR/AlgR family response regulator transcription factor n=1 Tax=Companilactobacillus sp. HBUAS56257 TaxID=3109360 RepID=UPI002FEECA4A
MSYPIIICEDNSIELKQLKILIENYLLFHKGFYEIGCIAKEPVKILQYLKSSVPNNGIYILDIDLKSNINGIDLAQKIRNIDVEANIIFSTTHEEMARETLKRKVGAIAFIEKNQNLEDYRDDIYQTLKYIKTLIEKSSDYRQQNFIFGIGTQIFNFNQNEVFSVEASKLPHQLIFTSNNGQYEFYGKLNDLEKKYSFLFRINRSCLVNPQNIRKINFPSRTIILKNGITKKFSIRKFQ